MQSALLNHPRYPSRWLTCVQCVAVRCKGVTVNVAVNVETTTIDLLFDVSKKMTHPLNVLSSVVYEIYASVGLERRIRKFERIEDVLNSWDRDTHNYFLVLIDCFNDPDLELSNVPSPELPPPGFELSLYHSRRPGKWEKRFVVLLRNGQMLASKKANPKPADKETETLLDLQDFDIYSPTPAKMCQELKPPKKHCYAIKSQLKSTFLVRGEDYAHFFSTEDSYLAQKFHDMVHAWRSWHLAERLAEVKKKQELDKPPQIGIVKHKPKKSISHVRVRGHKVKVSLDEAPYSIGEFQPLLDLNRFDKPLDKFGEDWELDIARRSAMLLQARADMVADAADNTAVNTAVKAHAEANGRAFAVNGLLGDADDKRDAKASDGPLPEGPTLHHGSVPAAAKAQSQANEASEEPPAKSESLPAKQQNPPPKAPAAAAAAPPPQKSEPSSWFPSASEHTAMTRQRSASTAHPSTVVGDQQRWRRPVPGPLIDLSADYVEVPQWAQPRRGENVPEGLRFITMGTGPAPPSTGRHLEVPSRNPVRREPVGAGVPRGPHASSASAMAAVAAVGHGSGAAGGVPARPSTSSGRPTTTRSRSATQLVIAPSARRGQSVSHSSGPGGHGYDDRHRAPPVPPLPSNALGFPIPPRPAGTIGQSAGRSTSARQQQHPPPPHQHEHDTKGRDPRARVRPGRSGSVSATSMGV